jgi:hypothetical protein
LSRDRWDSPACASRYGEQNSDLMRDPEMCFELWQPIQSKLSLDPYYWRND